MTRSSSALGQDRVRTGRKLAGFTQDEGGVTVHLTDATSGIGSETVRGDILVAADGIHSAARKIFYPNEGRPSWNGVMMWRGAADFPQYDDGQTMYIGGGMGAKFVLYPIANAEEGRKLTNWVVNVKVADGDSQPPPKDSWSRKGRLDDVLPYGKRFVVPGVDIEALIRASDAYYEYPMCDRDPLPRWTFGRVTLLGDAAHPMYPVGSNGASQAILDARCLSDLLVSAEHPMPGALSLRGYPPGKDRPHPARQPPGRSRGRDRRGGKGRARGLRRHQPGPGPRRPRADHL